MSKNMPEHSSDDRGSFEAEHLQKYLVHVADTLGIQSPKYRLKSGSKKGENYVGIIYRILIEGEKNGTPVKIQTIFKVPPKDEIKRRSMQVAYFFPREHLFYTEIVPIFKDFLKQKNNNSFVNIPQCYFSTDVDRKEVICLEDLEPKGFEMIDGMKQLDFAHASLAFRALGRLHALSFALRDQRPEIFNSKITTLKETLYRSELCANERFISIFKKHGALIAKTLAGEDPKYKERFSEFLKNISSHLEQSCIGSLAEPYAVLCHGDYRVNNFLFKYEENRTDPQDIYLLDFQLVRYASPALDISYTLFCNCGQEMRNEHFHELLKIYHDSLSAYLLELGSDPKKLFPYEALLHQLRKFSKYSAGLGLTAIPMFLSEDDAVPGGNNDNNYLDGLQARIIRDRYLRNTLRDTYKDLIDRNYI